MSTKSNTPDAYCGHARFLKAVFHLKDIYSSERQNHVQAGFWGYPYPGDSVLLSGKASYLLNLLEIKL